MDVDASYIEGGNLTTTDAPKPSIVIIDHDVGYSPKDIAKVAAALQKQVNQHFSLPPPYGYGIKCSVRAATAKKPPLPSEWVMGLFKTPDQPGALGYHDETASGLPLMKIFPLLDPTNPWSITASHELLETLADPNICRCAQAPDGKIWAYEVCDGVEADSYKIDDVPVSNFALPPYFEPPSNLTGVKLDYMGLCTQPYETRKGGYNQYWDGKTWHQIENSQRDERAALSSIGRGSRRRKKFV